MLIVLVCLGKTINMTSDNIAINSNNFSVDKNGNITATGGTIGGFGLSSNSFSKQLSGLYDYSLFDLCMTRLNLLDALDLSLDPTLVDILDYNGDGDPDVVDYLNILKVIQGKITNTKTKQGTFRINANNPKNCLTIEDSSGDVCVSLGMGGVNSNIVITKNIICSNTKTESREVPYILIDGINGQISLHSTTTSGPARTRINYEGITTPTVTQTSLESEKKNFEKYENALEILKNIDIYKYNLKSEEDGSKKHIGFVIGDNYNYSEEVTSTNNDGADIYSFVSLCCKAIQEQQAQIEELQKEIQELKGGK